MSNDIESSAKAIFPFYLLINRYLEQKKKNE